MSSPDAPPTGRALPSRPVAEAEAALLATLPQAAGGLRFDGVQIVHKSFLLAGHPFDDVLRALGKERDQAVAVFRYGDAGTIGAATVSGVGGADLLQAFVENWNAPAVIARSRRPPVEHSAWTLQERDGTVHVVLRREVVVYVISMADDEHLEAVLLDVVRSSNP